MMRMRVFWMWKSPPRPKKASEISLSRAMDVEPMTVWSIGLSQGDRGADPAALRAGCRGRHDRRARGRRQRLSDEALRHEGVPRSSSGLAAADEVAINPSPSARTPLWATCGSTSADDWRSFGIARSDSRGPSWLVATLMRNAGNVLRHEQLLATVWGPQYRQELHYLRVYVRQLRKKIEENPARLRYLITESWVGYRLNVP
jgi:hypothetical protein